MPDKGKQSRPRPSKWDTKEIYLGHRSPLASVDLRTLLASPAAWDVLDSAEKEAIISLMPNQSHVIKTSAGSPDLNLAGLRNDTNFRRDCAAYTESLAEGRHESDWLQEAWSAHKRRLIGDFDQWLTDDYEHTWDTELPESHRAPRRHTANGGGLDATGSSYEAPELAKPDLNVQASGMEEGSAQAAQQQERSQGAQHKPSSASVPQKADAAASRDGVAGPSVPVKRQKLTHLYPPADSSEDELA